MMNLKDGLRNLLVETIVSDEELAKLRANRQEREKASKTSKQIGGTAKSTESGQVSPNISKVSSFWSRPAFYMLCEEGIIKTGTLDKISICLHTNFNPKTNKSFLIGINEFISFYLDIIQSYNNKTLIDKVKEAVDNLQEGITGDRALAEETVEEILNFFYNEKTVDKKKKTKKPLPDRKSIVEKDYDKLVEQLTNLCIASNIVNWERLATLGSSSNVFSIKDIFKLDADNPDINQEFVSNLNPVVLKNFYASNNEFSKFLSGFSWGKPLTEDVETEKGEEEDYLAPVGNISGAGDVGTSEASGDNEKFVYNVLVRYLVEILTTDTLNVSELFKKANSKAVDSTLNAADWASHVSTEEEQEKRANSDISAEEAEADLDDPEISAGGSLADQVGLDVEDPVESISNIISFHNYVETLKTQNNWDTKNTLEFLSTTLKTSDGGNGLSAILTRAFSVIPDTLFGYSFDCQIIVNNIPQNFNTLSEIKKQALNNSNFIDFLSNILVVLSEVNLNEAKSVKFENKSIIFNQISSILQEAKRFNNYGLLPIDVEELIDELPKTRDEAVKAYSISHNDQGYSIIYNNEAARKINSIFNKVSERFPAYSRISPSPLTPISPEGLNPGSSFQKSLGINIVPAETSTIISTLANITPKQAKVGFSATKLDTTLETPIKKAKLSELFDIYLKTITDILKPSTNLPSWGLYKIIPATIATSKRDLSNAKSITAFPSMLVPKGSKIDGKLIKFVFSSEAEFNITRDAILNAVSSRKEQFIAATDLKQIKGLLSEISLAFGNKQELRFFSSPDTVIGTPEAKACKLWQLLDPKYAITIYLENVELYKAFPSGNKGTNKVNPFVDLVSNILVLNNQSTNEAIINSNRFLEAIRAESYELPICYVAINTQIRANLLLALVKLSDAIESLLIILRRLVIELHNVLIEKLSGDNFGEIASLFKYLATVLVDISSKTYSSDEELSLDIQTKIKPVKDRFEKSEAIRKDLINSEQDIPTKKLAPNIYG